MWFKLQFKRLLKRDEPVGYDTFACSEGWFDRFKARRRIVKRKKTNKKTIPIEKRASQIRNFHLLLHKIKNDEQYIRQCADYRRFRPTNIYVFDEVSMPFIYEEETTYDTEGVDRVYIKAVGGGLEKRQFTVGVTLRAEGRQHIEPVIIFRGKGDKRKLKDMRLFTSV